MSEKRQAAARNACETFEPSSFLVQEILGNARARYAREEFAELAELAVARDLKTFGE